jgi:hypothetical protein
VWKVKGVRPRWWYITFANCQDNETIDVEYEISFANKDSGKFSHEFSKDEQGLLFATS